MSRRSDFPYFNSIPGPAVARSSFLIPGAGCGSDKTVGRRSQSLPRGFHASKRGELETACT
ncbi:hypothetical protein P280DRAFT_472492 [Massarina eburnea CBS 473.64]|uniref:Uncharacterized protein n=1 Tax=Massarina eburnea CBS 473.64 TaxID=1395130 RepID=A0A6A6RNU3_9PLEO|nr:hypothetical protein P280DRAFT_472492 [Massarina eburnea CBS 473.64]